VTRTAHSSWGSSLSNFSTAKGDTGEVEGGAERTERRVGLLDFLCRSSLEKVLKIKKKERVRKEGRKRARGGNTT